MTDISKFLSNVEKSKKMDRQKNSGSYDYNRIADNLRRLFNNATSCPTELPDTLFGYWQDTYILTSANITEEPSQENLNKLAAILAFLDNSDEFQDQLSQDDWQEIGELVNDEAEDLPIDILQDLMKILVEKGAY
ncbi:MAG: hypothetical protein K5866_08935 [Treponema sp.]|nr:hypothetical protein [Treponema sp.]